MAELRSGCECATLPQPIHGNQTKDVDDDDQIIGIPKHDDIWLIGDECLRRAEGDRASGGVVYRSSFCVADIVSGFRFRWDVDE